MRDRPRVEFWLLQLIATGFERILKPFKSQFPDIKYRENNISLLYDCHKD